MIGGTDNGERNVEHYYPVPMEAEANYNAEKPVT